VAVTALDSARHETGHRMPCFLPDGDHFLFAALPSGPRGWEIYVGSLGSKKVKRILTAGSGVTYAAPGYLLYVRDAKLVAQRFDARTLKLSGDPVPIGDPPDSGPVDASRIATASDDGRLVMLRNRAPDTRVEWVDRAGVALGRVPLPPGRYNEIAPSPDGGSVLASRGASNVTSELWLADPGRGTTTRLSAADANEFSPRWLPDGSGYAFGAVQKSGSRIYVTRLGDPAGPRLVPTIEAQFQSVTGVTPDGRALILSIVDPIRQFDVWMAPTDGGAKPTLLVGGSAWEDRGAVSPDGRWLTFNSDETGQPEVYVQPFPGPGPRTRVSFAGGHDPCWTRGGQELLYQRDETGGGSVIAVTVTAGDRFGVGAPRTLFHRSGMVAFSAAADGERILVSADAAGAAPPSISLTLNWTRQLAER
jgi:Tol biopolymer transport system component